MTKITVLSLIAGVAGTGVGGLLGIVFADKGKKFVSCVLNFAAGIMLAMVFLNLIPTALTQSDTPQIKLIVLVGVVLGGAGIYLLNLAINGVNLRVHAVNTDNTAKNFLKSGIILFLAISLSVHCAFVMSFRAVGFGLLSTAAAFCDICVLSL